MIMNGGENGELEAGTKNETHVVVRLVSIGSIYVGYAVKMVNCVCIEVVSGFLML